MLDIKITGGSIIDGSGSSPVTGDIGIKDGKITAVGVVDGSAKETIDVSGAIVTPGFVDLHTHYDGQVSWDEELMPSSIHGVTTCAMGSCGVGFAPVRPDHHQTLIELMEGVEDIPGSALAEGIRWGWESFPEYMQRIDAMPHTIDFLCHVPHDALRLYVMGERATHDEIATPEDIATMRRLLRESLEAGAVGFSTGRSDNHRSATGEWTPSSEANADELAGIAEAFVGQNHGVLQVVNDFNLLHGDDHFEPEWDVLEAMLRASGGRPMSISTMQRDHSPSQWRWILGKASKMSEQGFNVRCQVGARGIGVLLGLQATFHPFMGYPSYLRIADLPLAERVATMRDPRFKAKLLSEKSGSVAGDGSKLSPLADYFLENLALLSLRLFRLGETPDYEPPADQSFGATSIRDGSDVLSLIYDALLENDGESLLYFPVYNYSGMNLEAVREMLEHPLALPGLSDSGAHVGTICDASFSTFLMTHWARDRQTGRIPLERIIKMQTQDTADFLGLRDRGRLAPGLRADLNIIDFDNLRLKRPTMLRDLPAGGIRLMQHAEGYLATFVGGECIAKNGELTGARPGHLVRSS